MIKLTALLLSLLCCNSYAAEPQSNISRQTQALLEIEALKNHLYQLGDFADPEELMGILQSNLSKLRSLSESNESTLVKREALKSYYSVKLNLKLIEKSDKSKFETDLMNFYSRCESTMECSKTISDLSEITLVWPSVLARHIYAHLLPEVRKISGLPGKILDFQAQSLYLNVKYYEALVRYNQSLPLPQEGIIPRLKKGYKKILVYSLDDLENYFWEILNISHHNFLSESELEFATVNQAGILLDTLVAHIDSNRPEVKDIMIQFVRSFLSTNEANQQLRHYIDRRVDHVEVRPYLEWLSREAKKSPLFMSAARNNIARFMLTEVKLASRHEWIKHSRPLFVENDPFQLMDIQTKLVQQEDENIKAWLGQFGFSEARSLATYKETIDDKLLNYEFDLAKKFSSFHSLNFQINLIKQKMQKLSEAALNLKRSQEVVSSNHTNEEDENINELKSRTDFALADILRLACYSGQYPGTGKKRPYRPNAYEVITRTHNPLMGSIKIPFIPLGSFQLDTVCGGRKVDWSQVKGTSNPYVNKYILNRRFMAHMTPVLIEGALTAITIPLTLASAGAAAPVARGATSLALKYGSQLAIRYSAGLISKLVLTQLIPRVASAIAGSIVFSIVNRVGLWTVTLGQVKLYDSKKTLWQNYGQELLFGSMIFFFLPISSALSQNAARRIINPTFFKKHPRIAEFLGLGIGAGADTVIFTSLPYIERIATNLVSGKSEPIFRGSQDFFNNLSHSAMIALAFKISAKHRIQFETTGESK